jgi:Kelch motif
LGGVNSTIRVVDLNMNRIFGLDMTKSRLENKPSTVRINYSITHHKNKVFIYGGIDQDNKILDSVEEFDVTTYKFNHPKIRGEFKPRGRQAHCAFAVDAYNIYIFGGSY